MTAGKFRALRTLLGFGLLPLLSAGSVLITIPALISVGGAQGWSAIAIAQGLGAAGAILVTFGWGVVGPTEVARADRAAQEHIYWVSCAMRSTLLVIVAPIVLTATILLTDTSRADGKAAVLTAIGLTFQGLGPSWYLIGQARPGLLSAMDSVPRLVGALLSAALVLSFDSLIPYGVVTLVVESCIALVAFLRLARRQTSRAASWSEARSRVRTQAGLMISVICSVGYTRLSVPIVSVVSYQAVPLFAAMDRVSTLSRTGIRPFVNFFQTWVVRDGAVAERRRAMAATLATVSVGLVGGIAIAVALPTWLGRLIFTDEVPIDRVHAALGGAIVVLLSAGYSVSVYYLVPRGKVRALAASTIVGALVGVPTIAVGAAIADSRGALTGVVVCELLVLVIQLVAARSATNESSQTKDSIRQFGGGRHD